jgi:hypothetical protein
LPNHASHFGGQYREYRGQPCSTGKAGGRSFLNPGRYGLSASAERRPCPYSHSRHARGSCRRGARPGYSSAYLQRRESPRGVCRSRASSIGRSRAHFFINLSSAGCVFARIWARIWARVWANTSPGGCFGASAAQPVIQQQRCFPSHRPLLLQNLRQVGKALQSTVESSASANPVKDEGVFLLWQFLPHRCARA